MRGFFTAGLHPPLMQGNLPPEAQEKVEQLQDLQETARQVATQKQQAESNLTDSQTALEALDDIAEDTVMYREVGELLVETGYDDARKNLKEKVENLEVRVETLEKQEERVQQQFEQLQEELQQMLQGAGGMGGPGAGGS